MKARVLLGLAWLAVALPDVAQSPAAVSAAATGADEPVGPDWKTLLPDEPAKGLVLVQCDHCHGLEWVAKSGATLAGGTDRVRRMNRAGALIPEEQIPLIAAYLAKTFPERPRPATADETPSTAP